MGDSLLLIIFLMAIFMPSLILSDPSLTIIQPQNKVFVENDPIIVECTFNSTTSPEGSLKAKFQDFSAVQLMKACFQQSTLTLQLSIECVNDKNLPSKICFRYDASPGLRFCRYLIQPLSGDARGLEIFCRNDYQVDSQREVFDIKGLQFCIMCDC